MLLATVHLPLLLVIAVSLITLLVVVAVQAKPLWSRETRLYASGGKQADGFATAVAIEQDKLVVAARRAPVYMFDRSGSTRIERAKLLPQDSQEAIGFIRSVAVRGDCSEAVMKCNEAESRTG